MDRPAIASIVPRFWRGGFALSTSFWLFGVLGIGACALIVDTAEDAALARLPFDPRLILAVFATGLACGLVVHTWILVGLWRSAAIHAGVRQAAARSAFWARAAQATGVVAAAHIVATSATATGPTLGELGRMAFLGDPSVPAFRMRLADDGAELEIDGGFKFGLVDRFLVLAKDAPRLRVVVLNSPGGRVGEAERLRSLIRARGLDTYVAASCVSACTIAFAGGRRRWLAPDGTLGFHSPSFRGARIDATGPGDESDIFRRAGIAPDFIARARAVSPTEVWRPSLGELREAGVVTGIVAPERLAASGRN